MALWRLQCDKVQLDAKKSKADMTSVQAFLECNSAFVDLQVSEVTYNVHQQTCTHPDEQKVARNEGFVAPPAMHLLCTCSMWVPSEFSHLRKRSAKKFAFLRFPWTMLYFRDREKSCRKFSTVHFLVAWFARIDSHDSRESGDSRETSDSGESAWRAIKKGFHLRMIRAESPVPPRCTFSLDNFREKLKGNN